jgi:hypothetical protein
MLDLLLALALLVARVRANHVQPTVPADDLAVLTNALDAGTNLHHEPLATSGKSLNKANQ